MQKYTRQIILSLQSTLKIYEAPDKLNQRMGMIAILKQKAEQKDIPIEIHYLDHPKDTELKFKITPRTLIYIIAKKGQNDALTGINNKEETVTWSIEQLAELIVQNYALTAKKIYLGESDELIKPKLTLSLIIDAAGKEGLTSFAGKLSKLLYSTKQLETNILARTGIINPPQENSLQKTVDGSYHKNDTKIIITIDGNGQQVLYPINYDMKTEFEYLAKITGTTPHFWHDHGNNLLGSLLGNEKILKDIDTIINNSLPQNKVKTGITPSKTPTYHRMLINKEQFTTYLKLNLTLSENSNHVDTGKDLAQFLKDRTSLTYHLNGDIEFVSEKSFDLEELKSKNDACKNQGFATQLVETKDLSQSYCIYISIQNVASALNKYKLECQEKLNKILNGNDQYDAITNSIIKKLREKLEKKRLDIQTSYHAPYRIFIKDLEKLKATLITTLKEILIEHEKYDQNYLEHICQCFNEMIPIDSAKMSLEDFKVKKSENKNKAIYTLSPSDIESLNISPPHIPSPQSNTTNSARTPLEENKNDTTPIPSQKESFNINSQQDYSINTPAKFQMLLEPFSGYRSLTNLLKQYIDQELAANSFSQSYVNTIKVIALMIKNLTNCYQRFQHHFPTTNIDISDQKILDKWGKNRTIEIFIAAMCDIFQIAVERKNHENLFSETNNLYKATIKDLALKSLQLTDPNNASSKSYLNEYSNEIKEIYNEIEQQKDLKELNFAENTKTPSYRRT